MVRIAKKKNVTGARLGHQHIAIRQEEHRARIVQHTWPRAAERHLTPVLQRVDIGTVLLWLAHRGASMVTSNGSDHQ